MSVIIWKAHKAKRITKHKKSRKWKTLVKKKMRNSKLPLSERIGEEQLDQAYDTKKLAVYWVLQKENIIR